jgi:hypothetical protein
MKDAISGNTEAPFGVWGVVPALGQDSGPLCPAGGCVPGEKRTPDYRPPPPHSPDLTPADFFWFPMLNKELTWATMTPESSKRS